MGDSNKFHGEHSSEIIGRALDLWSSLDPVDSARIHDPDLYLGAADAADTEEYLSSPEAPPEPSEVERERACFLEPQPLSPGEFHWAR